MTAHPQPFSIFAFSGWESTGPLAEESKNPKRNVPIGLVGSVVILTIYFVFVTWGYLVGIGVKTPIAAITDPNAASRWPPWRSGYGAARGCCCCSRC